MTDVLKPLSENTSIPSGIVPVVVTSGPVSRTLTVRATLMRDKGLKTITEGNSLNVYLRQNPWKNYTQPPDVLF